jgi:hypothetical protein
MSRGLLPHAVGIIDLKQVLPCSSKIHRLQRVYYGLLYWTLFSVYTRLPGRQYKAWPGRSSRWSRPQRDFGQYSTRITAFVASECPELVSRMDNNLEREAVVLD